MTPALKQMLIDGFVPKWVDKEVLAVVISNSPDTIDNWAAQGIIPPPIKRGGKLMWKWADVDAKLTLGNAVGSPDSQAERIANGTKAALADARSSH